MLEQPDVRPENTKEWVLWEDYTYTWTEKQTQCRLTTKAGYITDLASVPKLFWNLLAFQPDGLHRAAALLHDRLYQRRGYMPGVAPQGGCETFYTVKQIWLPTDRTFTREECDRLFLKIMLEAGESEGTAKAMFWAVRAFGWMHW